VEEVGPAVKKVQKGQRYVASFQIACGDVRLQNMAPTNTI
jgi:threonine dehydrogenase-like Zn-dependent dehydrogenase